jgi:hypothetical protein
MNEELRKQLEERINALTSQAEAAVSRLDDLSKADRVPAEEFKAVQDLLNGADGQPGLQAQIAALTAEKQDAEYKARVDEMHGTLTTLQGAIADLRSKPSTSDAFTLTGDNVAAEGLDSDAKAVLDAEDPYLDVEGKSADFATRRTLRRSGALTGVKGGFFRDVKLANRGHADALKRITHGFQDLGLNEEGKALTEGSGITVAAPFPGSGSHPTGGYLVRPQIERQLVLARELDNIMRGLCSTLNVTSTSITLDQLGLSATAGWVGELAT